MRKNHIDNLRFICVLLLFPYHTLMIYNTFENFYIKGAAIKTTTAFIYVSWPWFMPLLFTIAGISAAYALRKRSVGGFVKERVTKLLIPLAAGILLLIPAQTYFAERFHNGYTGGYLGQYILFFTKPTDLTGYTGGFTPGQLWFILYLFVISLAAVPIVLLVKKKRLDFGAPPLPVLLCLFILPVLGSLVLDIGGKSLGEYFVYFIFGNLLLSDDTVQEKLERRRKPLLVISAACLAVMCLEWFGEILTFIPWPLPDIFSRFYGWVTILALLGYSRKYLGMSNKFTLYMSRSSFSVYVFHQTWIIAAAYYAFRLTDSPPVQIPLILLASVALTFATYEIFRRCGVTRFLFAIRK